MFGSLCWGSGRWTVCWGGVYIKLCQIHDNWIKFSETVNHYLEASTRVNKPAAPESFCCLGRERDSNIYGVITICFFLKLSIVYVLLILVSALLQLLWHFEYMNESVSSNVLKCVNRQIQDKHVCSFPFHFSSLPFICIDRPFSGFARFNRRQHFLCTIWVFCLNSAFLFLVPLKFYILVPSIKECRKPAPLLPTWKIHI